MKQISILGSTGSIGRQTLEVVNSFPEELNVVALAAGRNRELFLEQCKAYKPLLVSLQLEEDALWLKEHLIKEKLRPEIRYGLDGLVAVATCHEAVVVVTALSGAIGLVPTCAAIKASKKIALANKETLVAAGQYVTKLAEEYKVEILPVDSEHSAIWQCLHGENRSAIRKIQLTASGGPFRQLNRQELENVTPEMALKHPNWSMGQKITIDSATLMNKGLEVIEAKWLFGVDYDDINVVVHPQSVIHSMVEYGDGSLLAHLGMPDMRIPIQYALSYPERWFNHLPKLNLTELKGLTFEEPDTNRFPSLSLAYQAGKIGGTAPAVLNAANEVAVHAFLAGQIKFMQIPSIVKRTLNEHQFQGSPVLEEILEIDGWAREEANKIIRNC
ncbi:1-deoxy-D-xylulose-5-phosphate reductoisomerase [Desulforamulus reducens]|nr:1-deoxy-D-xylulose-5-phosphate reductoisomerase [Desulforamulus reducens]